LGTSTSKEFKEYFQHKKIVEFSRVDECREELDKVFRKTRADDRKTWLEHYDKSNTLDTNVPSISYADFINKEMIHFSKYDNERSIPNLMDGLKTSLRKILYCAFKRNLTKEIKVAQFGGYVSEHSGYHHGEMSLMQAIVGMAQEYVGSNNINLLLPNGQFGTRLQGGADSASERYIFTQLNTITKQIYRPEDNGVLHYLDDDGTLVEPEFYVPILPMILVNGSTGIGTGFSTDIMCYNPSQIVTYIKNHLQGISNDAHPIEPYYEGFNGTISKVEDDKYLFKGAYEVVSNDVIRITELPVGTWTENYKAFLEKQMEQDDKKDGKRSRKKVSVIKDYKDMSTDTKVDITITFQKGTLSKLLEKPSSYGCNELENVLNLTTTRKTSNMHMFDEKQCLRKFESPEEIITHYIPLRIHYYRLRKEHLVQQLEKEVLLLSNKARFIEEQCEDVIDLRRKKKGDVIALLTSRKYDLIGDEEYKYLRSMPIDSVIEENIVKLRKERDAKMKELETLKATSLETMWLSELNEFETSYQKYIEQRNARQKGVAVKRVVKRQKKVKKAKKVKKLSKKIKLVAS
jgi:DNA topoisomerase-2